MDLGLVGERPRSNLPGLFLIAGLLRTAAVERVIVGDGARDTACFDAAGNAGHVLDDDRFPRVAHPLGKCAATCRLSHRPHRERRASQDAMDNPARG